MCSENQNDIVDEQIIGSDKNNINQQVIPFQKGYSPVKNKSMYIKVNLQNCNYRLICLIPG